VLPWRRNAGPARTACWPCSSSPPQTRTVLNLDTPQPACALCDCQQHKQHSQRLLLSASAVWLEASASVDWAAADGKRR
jgi:hypothetical protein